MLHHAKTVRRSGHRRRGITLPLLAALIVVLIGLLAFAVDLGYISLVRGQMQTAADAAALASASQLLDRDWLQGDTSQSLAEADAQAGRFAAANRAGGVALKLGTGDVEYGYIANPRDPGSPFDVGRTPYNSARVTVQRTEAQNGELGLFFAKIFNRNSLPLQTSATATYEGAIGGFEFNDNDPHQKSLLLPYTVHVDHWEAAFTAGSDLFGRNPETGEVTAVGDGILEVKLFPTSTTSGNFGTIDIGSSDNSTSDIERQTLNGPSRADFEAMGRKFELGTDGTLVLDGDTGISAGVKDAMKQIEGQARIIPLYTTVTGDGDNSRFTITRFVGCTVVSVKLTGGDKHILIQPEFAIDPTAKGGGPESDHSFAFQPLRLTR